MNRQTIRRISQAFVPFEIGVIVRALRESHFVAHLVGKLRRFCLVHLRKGYVQEQLLLRKGECLQCGHCCSLLFKCPMLTPQGLCRTYDHSRWQVCKVFPIDDRDLADVALAGGRCGYYFEEGS